MYAPWTTSHWLVNPEALNQRTMGYRPGIRQPCAVVFEGEQHDGADTPPWRFQPSPLIPHRVPCVVPSRPVSLIIDAWI